MSFEDLTIFTDTNHWLALWPELVLAGLALSLLLLEVILGQRAQRWIPILTIAALKILFVAQAVTFAGFAQWTDGPLFSGMIVLSETGQVMRLFLIASAILAAWLAQTYFKKQTLPRVEFYNVLLVVTAAMMLLSQSAHFVMLFVALETVTVGFYVLVSYCRTNPASLEAGLKYLILGGVSSAILLFGIVLLYGAAGMPDPEFTAVSAQLGLPQVLVDPIQFGNLQAFIAAHPDSLLVNVGALLVLAGIAFKIAAFPFQIWVPDVYQGAPTPVTAFLAVGSKAAGFFVLINLMHPDTGPLAPLFTAEGNLVPFLVAITAITILFGNLTALPQRNVKRLMGLSGVAHAGYLLVGVVALVQGSDLALGAILFYLVTYLLGSFAVFGVMAHVAGEQDEAQELQHYANLARRGPFLSGVLAIGLGSLAGIPPLAGFIGKVFLFIAAFQAEAYVLLGVAVLGAVISIYYYFGWVQEAFFLFRSINEPEMSEGAAANPSAETRPALHLGVIDRLSLGALAVLVVVVGIYQGLFAGWLF
ncbi:MAG: NADH-quinone oxidoreductase subunit N [Opitutales bacterium]